jgi:hypothetical protein
MQHLDDVLLEHPWQSLACLCVGLATNRGARMATLRAFAALAGELALRRISCARAAPVDEPAGTPKIIVIVHPDFPTNAQPLRAAAQA